jgi:hypothetical protein
VADKLWGLDPEDSHAPAPFIVSAVPRREGAGIVRDDRMVTVGLASGRR